MRQLLIQINWNSTSLRVVTFGTQRTYQLSGTKFTFSDFFT